MARRPNPLVALLSACALALLAQGGTAAAQDCTVSNGEEIVQGLLDDFIPPFDAAWPTICQQTGLDPFDNVYDGSVNLGCGLGDLGDTVCGLEASSCKSMWADVDVSQISGLENLTLTSLTVTSTTATTGTTCPYSSKAVDDTSFGCSFSGEGDGVGALTGTLTADLSSIQIRVECDALGGLDDFKETIWEGHATATATGGTATANLEYCAGICSVDSGVASLVYLGMSDLKLKLDGVSVNVVSTGSSIDPDLDVFDEIADSIADALKTTIEAALSPVISEALNDEVKEILPLPESCSSASASASSAPAPAPQALESAPQGALVCYDAGLTADSAPFTQLNDMTLVDAEETSRVAVVRPAQICNPVAGATSETERHFVGYVLRPEFGAPVTELPDAVLANEFGVQPVRFGEVLPDMLFSAATPDQGALDVGCILAPGAYRCTAAEGLDAASSPGLELRATEAFDDRIVRVESLRSVCGPLRTGGIPSDEGWLACYTAVPASAPLGVGSESEVAVVSGVGSQTLAPLGSDRRLCVPTEIAFSASAASAASGSRAAVRSPSGSGLSSIGGSCPVVRRHLDPGLGIYEPITVVLPRLSPVGGVKLPVGVSGSRDR